MRDGTPPDLRRTVSVGVAEFLIVVSLATVAPAAISQPPIDSPPILVIPSKPASGTLVATSEFDCHFFTDSCRFLYTLQTQAIDPNGPLVNVRWHDAGTNFNLAETMNLYGDRKQWYFDVPNGALELFPNPDVGVGDVDFSGLPGFLNTSAQAEYYIPPSNPIPVRGILDDLNDIGDSLFELFNGLVENPTLASYSSSVEQLGGGGYRYAYSVTNGTGTLLTYDWPDAGMSGELAIGESAARTFDSPLLPFAVIGTASTGYTQDIFGTDHPRTFRTPASAIVPLATSTPTIPEPNSLAVWVALVTAMLGVRRRSRHTARYVGTNQVGRSKRR